MLFPLNVLELRIRCAYHVSKFESSSATGKYKVFAVHHVGSTQLPVCGDTHSPATVSDVFHPVSAVIL